MDRQLIDYIPLILREIREMKVICTNSEQPEIERLWGEAENVFADQFILDATENGVKRWEVMLEIEPKGTDTLDERKFRILTRLNETEPYTITTLKQMLSSLCGQDGFFLTLHNNEYLLVVRVALTARSNYNAVKTLLEGIVPANLILNLSLLYNQHELLAKYTHAQLAEYTHYQLRNEVLENGETNP